MIKVEVTEGNVNVYMPVPKDPDNKEERAMCQTAITEDLVYLYKTIEDHYDKETLFFMLNLAAKTFALKHDKLISEYERKTKNENDDKRE